jgi:hypothetical protein
VKPTNRLKMMFDVDGVLAFFIDGFIQLYEKTWSQAFPIPLNEVKWDDLDDAKTWAAIKRSPNFWRTLRPLASTVELNWISAFGHIADIYFVTNRPGVDTKAQTECWLEAQGIGRPTVIVTGRKGEFAAAIAADFAIDDKAGNAVYTAYQSPGTRSYLVNRRYNQFPHDVLGSKVTRIENVYTYLQHAVAEYDRRNA